MNQFAKETLPVSLEEEMRRSYLDYAMSVIVGRALPDVRDGLKPVHRRVLHAMNELSNDWNRPYKKSARVVGDCFVAGALVHTAAGLMPIEQVNVGDEVLMPNGRLTPVVAAFHNPPDKVIDVILANGVSLTVTPGQLFRVLNDDLSIGWARADQLQGKRVLLSGHRSLGIADTHPSAEKRQDAYVAGLMVAEGYLTDRGRGTRVGIRMVDAEPLAVVEDDCHTHNVVARRAVRKPQKPHHQPQHQVTYSGEPQSYAVCEDTCAYKEVPDWVLQDRRLYTSFLAGYTDGDGYVRLDASQREAVLRSTSPKLLSQIQAMLADTGIHCSYTCEDFSTRDYGEGCLPSHCLYVTGENASRFCEMIQDHLQIQRKVEAAAAIADWDHRRLNTETECIPGREVFAELSRHHLGAGWYRDVNGCKFRAGIKYPGGSKIRYSVDLGEKDLSYRQMEEWGILAKLERIGSPLAAKLRHLMSTYDTMAVEAVVDHGVTAETYDVQVADESHEFLVQGFAVHNCIGKYHPHGDTAVYDTIVRMAQDFSLRYPLVDGQGNFGSVDGDNAAAMRYTEVRMARIAHELLADIEKETIDFGPNYDGSEKEPLVLPTRFPNLLANGSSGIAVGMATNIPPHNMNELIDGCLALLGNPEITIDELIELIPAPDFPTAGLIYGTAGVREGYRTGRGRVIMRARTHIETDKNGRESIIIDELPYQVNKANLLAKIGELVQEKRLEGISNIRDESDKSGMRGVIELKRDAMAEVVLNNLFKLTQMQDTFGMNMVALVDNQPRLLNLKQMLDYFLRHRREVVTRRTIFELRKARNQGHLLEGQAVALANIDEFIALIKAAPTPADAKVAIMARAWHSQLVEDMLARASADATRPEGLAPEFGLSAAGYRLSDQQADNILRMQLSRLTGLEQDKIFSEYKDVLAQILDLLDILAKPERITAIIIDELNAVRIQYGDGRKSEIVANAADISMEDLITPEDMVVTLSHTGYIKSQPVSDYRAQKRGGRGKQAAATKEDDFIDKLFVANTHDTILCFSSLGRVYWIKVYEVPQGSRNSRGKPIVNLLQIGENEKINAILPVKTFDEDHYVFFATANGIVKKTPLTDYSRPRTAGIIACDLDEGDYLVGVAITDGQHDVMLFSDGGKAVRFSEQDVRPMGRNARGVIGMRLAEKQHVISLVVADGEEQCVLTATENGYGKRTPVSEYTRHGRGTQGMIAIQTTERNGNVVAATLVDETDEIMLITNGGVLIRTRIAEVRVMGRSTQGVTLINLDEGEKLIGLERVAESEEDEGELEEGAPAAEAGPAPAEGQPAEEAGE